MNNRNNNNFGFLKSKNLVSQQGCNFKTIRLTL